MVKDNIKGYAIMLRKTESMKYPQIKEKIMEKFNKSFSQYTIRAWCMGITDLKKKPYEKKYKVQTAAKDSNDPFNQSLGVIKPKEEEKEKPRLPWRFK